VSVCCVKEAQSLSRRLFQLASPPCPSALDGALETPAKTHLRQSASIPLPAYRSKSTPVLHLHQVTCIGSFHLVHNALGSILPFHPPCSPHLRVSYATTSYQFPFNLLCLLLIIYPVFNPPLSLLLSSLPCYLNNTSAPPIGTPIPGPPYLLPSAS
jgi:hypothetical protein